ncbi:MAG: hypothetical protein OGMRLDGQ_002660, partial [Candidatus Fervidibacter sp.]
RLHLAHRPHQETWRSANRLEPETAVILQPKFQFRSKGWGLSPQRFSIGLSVALKSRWASCFAARQNLFAAGD